MYFIRINQLTCSIMLDHSLNLYYTQNRNIGILIKLPGMEFQTSY